MKDGRSFTTAQVLDDIRQIRRVEVHQFLLGHAQVEEIRAGEELDIFPGNKLIRKVIREEPTKGLIHYFLPSHPPHQSSKAHIDMNQPEIRAHSEEMKIIYPDHLCSEGI